MERTALAEFETAIPALRPELHRYTARMTGSVFDGEDVLQEVLFAATRAIRAGAEPENLRAWLFRIAHNTALNHIRRHRREVPMPDVTPHEPSEPAPASVADDLRAFVPLTPQQRSAVILRDVLGYTAPEVAALTDASVGQVKSALHRGRAALRRQAVRPSQLGVDDHARLAEYTRLFNAQAFDRLRDLLADEARLELVARETRTGSAAVGRYFHNYAAADDWWFAPGVVEERPCALVFDRADPGGAPRYVVLLDFADDEVTGIRDFRYATYVMTDATWSRAPDRSSN